jgi:hypothetical protein
MDETDAPPPGRVAVHPRPGGTWYVTPQGLSQTPPDAAEAPLSLEPAPAEAPLPPNEEESR